MWGLFPWTTNLNFAPLDHCGSDTIIYLKRKSIRIYFVLITLINAVLNPWEVFINGILKGTWLIDSRSVRLLINRLLLLSARNKATCHVCHDPKTLPWHGLTHTNTGCRSGSDKQVHLSTSSAICSLNPQYSHFYLCDVCFAVYYTIREYYQFIDSLYMYNIRRTYSKLSF